MGSNRSTVKAKARAKRRKREEVRLSRKKANPQAPQPASDDQPGIATKVKDAAVAAATTVAETVKAAAEAVKDAVTSKEHDHKAH